MGLMNPMDPLKESTFSGLGRSRKGLRHKDAVHHCWLKDGGDHIQGLGAAASFPDQPLTTTTRS